MDPKRLIDKTVAEIKAGRLDNFSPLIGLFQYERKPMTLDGHFMFLPLFGLSLPKYLTLQCGRQVSKSFTVAETSILRTGMIESFNSIYIAPRYDQLKRFHNQVLAMLLKTSPITPYILDKSGADAIEMKSFLNGNTLMLEHSFSSPDRVRGASNCASMILDESISSETEILVFHLTRGQNGVYYISDRPDIVPITEVKQGDIVMSFTENGCIYSPVVRDASYHGRRAIFKVTTQSGRILRCTADHRIHTNLGSMRLSDVIEYCCNSGDGEGTSTTGRDERLCSKCGGGDAVGGRKCSSSGVRLHKNISHRYGSRTETERLYRIQNEYIIRVREAPNIYAKERRLRQLCVSAADNGYRDIFIACKDGVPSGRLSEDGYRRIVEADNASDWIGTVVRGRRNACKEPQCGGYRNERFYETRSRSALCVAQGSVAHSIEATGSYSLEHRKACTYNSYFSGGFYNAVEFGVTGAPGIDALQTNINNKNMPGLWEGCAEGRSEPIVLSGVSGEVRKTALENVLRGAQGGASGRKVCLCGEVSGDTPRRNPGEITRKVRVTEPRRKKEAVCKVSSVDEEETRVLQDACTRALRETERGSGGLGEVPRRTQSLSEEIPTASQRGSGASCTCCREGEKAQSQSGVQKTATAVSSEFEEEQSGEVCGDAEAKQRSEKRTASCETCRADEIGKPFGTFVYDRIVSIEPDGEEDVYDIEVVGTHNYILANGMCSYNCQDINPDFLPVFESTTDASKFGIIQASGTPKTTDTLLELQFAKSSQCHWAIKCAHCAKWNIADIEEQLMQMIGKDGLSCAYCGKILNPRTGGWLPKFPERQNYHAGYHVPQIILPMHCENATKWKVLRSRQAEWSKTRFFNEVVGVASDDSVKLLTKNDLINDQNNFENNLDAAIRNRKLFDTVFIGVDWSGGGGGFSRTAISAIGRSAGHRESHVFYLETLPHGLTPEEEADRVAAIFSKLRANMVAHDYTGAGFVRESVLLGRHPYLQDKIYPFAYVFRTGSQLVSYADSGSRRSANVDKTRSLLLTFNSIRSKLLMLPKFDPFNNAEPVFELLNIVERPQEFSKASIKDVYILQRAPGRYDDAAHAINIAFIAQCDLTDSWPQFTMDPKYNMTDAQLEAITGKHDEVRL